MTDDKVFGDYNLMSNFMFKGYFFRETKAEIFSTQEFGSTQAQQVVQKL